MGGRVPWDTFGAPGWGDLPALRWVYLPLDPPPFHGTLRLFSGPLNSKIEFSPKTSVFGPIGPRLVSDGPKMGILVPGEGRAPPTPRFHGTGRGFSGLPLRPVPRVASQRPPAGPRSSTPGVTLPALWVARSFENTSFSPLL